MGNVEFIKYKILMPEDMQLTLRVLAEIKLSGKVALIRVAEAEGMSRDSLNSSVNRTENSLGHRLFNRETWKVNEAGESFLRRAPAVVEYWRRLEDALETAFKR